MKGLGAAFEQYQDDEKLNPLSLDSNTNPAVYQLEKLLLLKMK